MPDYPITEKHKSDLGKIVLGLLIFAGLMAAATVYNRARGQYKNTPVLELPLGQKNCVKDTKYMRENHMKLLDEWRQTVVRDGVRKTIKIGNQTYQKSLTLSCLKCHSNPKAFCDRCHEYAGVHRKGAALACFTCHIQPTGKTAARRASRR